MVYVKEAPELDYVEDRKAQSPIRTRREIVPGDYGIVTVSTDWIGVEAHNPTADELREAAHLFVQIAEVLEENAG